MQTYKRPSFDNLEYWLTATSPLPLVLAHVQVESLQRGEPPQGGPLVVRVDVRAVLPAPAGGSRDAAAPPHRAPGGPTDGLKGPSAARGRADAPLGGFHSP